MANPTRYAPDKLANKVPKGTIDHHELTPRASNQRNKAPRAAPTLIAITDGNMV
jgi:hypothetical protein